MPKSNGETIGFTEDEMFEKFSKQAQYMGGDCYCISYMGKNLFNSCTLKLREDWQGRFKKRKGRYFYK